MTLRFSNQGGTSRKIRRPASGRLCIALQIKNVYKRWPQVVARSKNALTRDGGRKRADIRRRNELRGLVFTQAVKSTRESRHGSES